MDYNADQNKVPYLLDEFSQLWETPFSPTNITFPCTIERPPGLSMNAGEQRMYMANHNLNTDIKLGSIDILVPSVIELSTVNGLSGFGSLGLASNHCTDTWGRPPNFLLVDYYNVGNGSVFEVAAAANNVTYKGHCCGSASGLTLKLSSLVITAVAAFLLVI